MILSPIFPQKQHSSIHQDSSPTLKNTDNKVIANADRDGINGFGDDAGNEDDDDDDRTVTPTPSSVMVDVSLDDEDEDPVAAGANRVMLRDPGGVAFVHPSPSWAEERRSVSPAGGRCQPALPFDLDPRLHGYRLVLNLDVLKMTGVGNNVHDRNDRIRSIRFRGGRPSDIALAI